jgi:hypothetical protein
VHAHLGQSNTHINGQVRHKVHDGLQNKGGHLLGNFRRLIVLFVFLVFCLVNFLIALPCEFNDGNIVRTPNRDRDEICTAFDVNEHSSSKFFITSKIAEDNVANVLLDLLKPLSKSMAQNVRHCDLGSRVFFIEFFEVLHCFRHVEAFNVKTSGIIWLYSILMVNINEDTYRSRSQTLVFCAFRCL